MDGNLDYFQGKSQKILLQSTSRDRGQSPANLRSLANAPIERITALTPKRRAWRNKILSASSIAGVYEPYGGRFSFAATPAGSAGCATLDGERAARGRA